MKKCPQCKSIYADDTLAFCLSDGTPLDRARDSEETVRLPVVPAIPLQPAFSTLESKIETSNLAAPDDGTPVPPRGAVSRVWIFTTVALFSVLIGVLTFMFMFGGTRSPVDGGKSLTGGNEDVPVEVNTIRAEISPENPAKQPDVPPGRTITPTPSPDTPHATYRVTGVASSDVLYIRPAPGNLKTFIGLIQPDAVGIIVTGSAVRMGKTTWLPVNYKGTSGWVNGKFITRE